MGIQSGGALQTNGDYSLTGAINFVTPPTTGGDATAAGTSTIVGTTNTQTLTNKTLTAPTVTTGTFTTPTLTTPIFSEYKVLAATITYTSTVTPATITGFSWTVVPGTYIFEMNLPTTMTTVGGLTVAFALTTAVLTSIQYQSYASTAADATTAVSTQGTTTTTATKVFDSKTAAYTYVRVVGSMVVGTGGTFVWTGTQNTSAGAGDVSLILLGAYAKMERVS